MIANTIDAPTFIEATPDWSKQIVVVSIWKTAIKVNREGGEQRFKVRGAPRLSISYMTSSIRPKSFALRRAESMAQLGSAVVVPIWTTYETASAFGTNSVTLGVAASAKFKVGSWVYVVQGSNKCFRKITSIASDVVNLSSGGSDIYPPAFSWGSFSAGARVYPCILGGRSANGYTFGLIRADIAEEQIEIEEL